ncbi:hypothetical protein [Tropicimonas isoalkanivorans]|uniref:Uncharacterized protein n=1 Tax=Tropicimonas isoalkanivorans TaxID=441112 RepID=A0A1I1DXE3_9RHOB|nr:hypothetical protein [Tropicimonas isoalkanivorans]SFB79571.1 hypothetical protein SAMN04488094_101528 [Tropicimonas isoalkanivorans]
MKLAVVAAAAVMTFGLPCTAQANTVDLDAVKAAVEKYKDVNVALADGYIPDPSGHCVTAAAEGLPAEWGGMGIHYLNPAMLGITGDKPRVNGNGTHTDWMKPAILLYEPQADGSRELVGVENLVWQAAWKETGNAAPEINGRLWDAMADDPNTEADEAHGFEPHFDQHVWLFRENPAGELMPFNAAVTCDHQATH